MWSVVFTVKRPEESRGEQQSGLWDLSTSRKSGALLSGVVAHSDHVLEDDVLLVHKGTHQLALLGRHVHLPTTHRSIVEGEPHTIAGCAAVWRMVFL